MVKLSIEEYDSLVEKAKRYDQLLDLIVAKNLHPDILEALDEEKI